MKTKSRTRVFTRILATVLTLMLAFAVAVPALGAENLTITIHNAKGEPKMVDDQFFALQIFKGNVNREGDAGTNPWGATEWNNWTLSDIEWGSAFKAGPDGGDDFLDNLKGIQVEGEGRGADAYFHGIWVPDPDIKNNIFGYCSTAADVAEVLVGKPHAFIEAFGRFLLYGAFGDESAGVTNVAAWIDTDATVRSVIGKQVEGKPEEDTSVIKVSEPGYYLITENFEEHDAHVNEFVSENIFAVLGNQEIFMKGSMPEVDKQIVYSDNNKYGDVAGVGDTVTFELDGTVADDIDTFHENINPYYYAFHDTLSKGLDFNEGSVQVSVETNYPGYIGKFDFTEDTDDSPGLDWDNENHYKVTTNPAENGTEINIVFENLYAALETVWEAGAGTDNWPSVHPIPWTVLDTTSKVAFNKTIKIYVTYTATLNDDAVVGRPGNPNSVYLEFSNDPESEDHSQTTEKKVYVYTFGLDVTKIGSDADHQDGLAGAGFTLKNATGQIAKFQTDHSNANKQIIQWDDFTVFESLYQAYLQAKDVYDKGTDADRAGALGAALQTAKSKLSDYVLYSGSNGKLPKIESLDEGSYTLSEVITPDGYNTMDDFTFGIDAVFNGFGELHSVKYTAPYPDGETVEYDADYLPDVFNSGFLPQTLENQKAPFLPFTGGIGRTVFYVAGVLLIGAAVAYIIIAARKRGKAESGK